MKKTILMSLAIALSAIGSGALMAQDNTPPPPQQNTQQSPAQPNGQPMPQRRMPSPDERAKRQTDRLNESAQLTPDQYAQVLQVNKDFMIQRDAASAGAPPNQMTPDQRNQMRNMQKDRDAKIKAILTPDQWQKVQDSRMRPSPGAPGGHMDGQ